MSRRQLRGLRLVNLVLLCALWNTTQGFGAETKVPDGFPRAWASVGDRFHELLEEQGVIGGSLLFLKHKDILGTHFHGFADREAGRKVDIDTIYHWASITKTFTAIGIMQLRDRVRLGLNDSVLNTCPRLRDVHNPFGSMNDITLRHLLTHSAGFRNSTWPWGGQKTWHPHEPTTWAQLLAMLPYTEISFPPGSKFSYSNPGIIFLGRAIETLSGDEYEVYVDKNIFKPLGMTRSYFDNTPYHLLKDRSNNYEVRGDEVRANGLDFDTGITVSNGGLNAPLPDMARYLAFLLSEESDVLSRASREEMWKPAVPIDSSGGLRSSMGLTFFLLDHGKRRFIGHTGGQKAFISFFYIHPPSGTGVLAAFNTLGISNEGPPRPNTRGILSELRLEMFESVFALFD